MKSEKFGEEIKMKKFDVTFTRYGFATIEAETEEEAWSKAEAYGKGDISWSHEFETTDVQEKEE